MFEVEDHVRKEGKGAERAISCKYCTQKLPANKDRWLSHLNTSCKQVPEYVKSAIPQKRKRVDLDSVTVLSHSDSGLLQPCDSASALSLRAPQQSVHKWIDRTDSALLDELNDNFASMIYATGVPFVFAFVVDVLTGASSDASGDEDECV